MSDMTGVDKTVAYGLVNVERVWMPLTKCYQDDYDQERYVVHNVAEDTVQKLNFLNMFSDFCDPFSIRPTVNMSGQDV